MAQWSTTQPGKKLAIYSPQVWPQECAALHNANIHACRTSTDAAASSRVNRLVLYRGYPRQSSQPRAGRTVSGQQNTSGDQTLCCMQCADLRTGTRKTHCSMWSPGVHWYLSQCLPSFPLEAPAISECSEKSGYGNSYFTLESQWHFLPSYVTTRCPKTEFVLKNNRKNSRKF